ncbi:MAG: aROK [Gammaproteobacteria bacterium]|nr:aROK [Gammaproteobacteria bacterium]
MSSLPNHIVLMGFKHVGKSIIGKNLARRLNRLFIDLDHQIELAYENKFNKKYNCRQIMQKVGQDNFRCLEVNVLRQMIDLKPSVISLGGGTVLHPENRKLIQSCLVVYITAPRDVVFERILMGGRPAFLNPEKDLLQSFNQLWNERKIVFESIQNYSIMNDTTVENAVDEILKKLNEYIRND